MGWHKRFGELLIEGIKKLTLTQNQDIGPIQQKLIDDLGVSKSTLYDWRKGKRLPEPHVIAKLARKFAKEGQTDQKWINDFLESAEYGPKSAVEALNQELFGQDSHDSGKISDPVRGRIDIEREIKSNLFGQEVIQPWTARVPWLFTKLQHEVTPYSSIQIIGLIVIWLGGWQLFRSFLAWPFTDRQIALEACLKYGLVSLVAPFLICLLSTYPRDNWRLWIMRCFNAYAGYYVTIIFCLGAALMSYSFDWWPWPTFFQSLVLGLPLAFAYSLTQQMPAKIMRNQPEELTSYTVRFSIPLVLFIALNLLTAVAFYFIYPWLLQQQPYLYVGGFILLAGTILAVIIVGTGFTKWD